MSIEEIIRDELMRQAIAGFAKCQPVEHDYVRFEGQIDLRFLAGVAKRAVLDEIADKFKQMMQG